MYEKYLKDAEALARQLETAAAKLRRRIDKDRLKNIASLHNQIQEAVSIATDLEVTVAVYRRVIRKK